MLSLKSNGDQLTPHHYFNYFRKEAKKLEKNETSRKRDIDCSYTPFKVTTIMDGTKCNNTETE